jgi:hypothetical protein
MRLSPIQSALIPRRVPTLFAKATIKTYSFLNVSIFNPAPMDRRSSPGISQWLIPVHGSRPQSIDVAPEHRRETTIPLAF